MFRAPYVCEDYHDPEFQARPYAIEPRRHIVGYHMFHCERRFQNLFNMRMANGNKLKKCVNIKAILRAYQTVQCRGLFVDEPEKKIDHQFAC